MSGSRLYYVKQNVETRSHRSPDGVIFIPVLVAAYHSDKHELCCAYHDTYDVFKLKCADSFRYRLFI